MRNIPFVYARGYLQYLNNILLGAAPLIISMSFSWANTSFLGLLSWSVWSIETTLHFMVGVYESFVKRWTLKRSKANWYGLLTFKQSKANRCRLLTFKRPKANRCRQMPEAQGSTKIVMLGDDVSRKMAVIFGGLAINVRLGREEAEQPCNQNWFDVS